MSNIIKRTSGAMDVNRARKEFATVANSIARTVSEIIELTDEQKKIRAAIKRDEEKRLARLREISQTLKTKNQQQSEMAGGYKVLKALLDNSNVELPRTKLEGMKENEAVAELVEAN